MKRLILITLVVTLLVSGIAYSQTSTKEVMQQWEYAVITWNILENSYAFNVSILYSEFGYVDTRDTVKQLFDGMAELDGASITDYLGIMGVNGYELVTSSNVENVLLFIFKRPTHLVDE